MLGWMLEWASWERMEGVTVGFFIGLVAMAAGCLFAVRARDQRAADAAQERRSP